MKNKLAILLILAVLTWLASCSSDSNTTSPTGPTTGDLLAGNGQSVWSVVSGTHHEWSPDPNTAEILYEYRPIEMVDFFSSRGWEVISQGGIRISGGRCAYRKYFTGCEVTSIPIDFSAWDSARITFRIRTDLTGEAPNGSASISLGINSNVPGVDNVGLAVHDTNDAEANYDLSLESVMDYREASLVVRFHSNADCNAQNTGYLLKLILSDLHILATRE